MYLCETRSCGKEEGSVEETRSTCEPSTSKSNFRHGARLVVRYRVKSGKVLQHCTLLYPESWYILGTQSLSECRAPLAGGALSVTVYLSSGLPLEDPQYTPKGMARSNDCYVPLAREASPKRRCGVKSSCGRGGYGGSDGAERVRPRSWNSCLRILVTQPQVTLFRTHKFAMHRFPRRGSEVEVNSLVRPLWSHDPTIAILSGSIPFDHIRVLEYCL
jgi:hypothetical protein